MKKINYCLFGLIVLFFVVSPVFASMEACNSYLDITIDEKIANATRIVVLVIQIVIPILLVIFGSIDFVKAVVAQKEDEIKKGQQTFVKRIIAAVIVFFIVAIVKLIVGFGAGKKSTNILNCVSCFVDGPNSKECQLQSNTTYDEEQKEDTEEKNKKNNEQNNKQNND